MEENVDSLVSYIFSGSSTALFDGSEFDGSLEKLPEVWMNEDPAHDLLHENFNLGKPLE